MCTPSLTLRSAESRDSLIYCIFIDLAQIGVVLTKWAQLARGKPWCEWFFTSPGHAVGWLSKVASAEIRKRRRRRVWSAALYLHEASVWRQANLTSLDAAPMPICMHYSLCILPHRRHNEGRVRSHIISAGWISRTHNSFIQAACHHVSRTSQWTWTHHTLPSSANWPHSISMRLSFIFAIFLTSPTSASFFRIIYFWPMSTLVFYTLNFVVCLIALFLQAIKLYFKFRIVFWSCGIFSKYIEGFD